MRKPWGAWFVPTTKYTWLEVTDGDRLKLGAIALEGQFTREMVAAIRSASSYLANYAVGGNALQELELCNQAADRIEAILSGLNEYNSTLATSPDEDVIDVA